MRRAPWSEPEGREAFCLKILLLPRFSENGVADLEMGRDNRRGKVVVVKYWLRIFL
jgi:hypothetical protein